MDPSVEANRRPKQEMQQLRANNGSMKLAMKLLTPWLHATSRVYYYASKAGWTFYTSHCRNGRNPTQQLIRINSWSKGTWTNEATEHFHNCFSDPIALKDMGLDWNAVGANDEEVGKQQDIAKNLAEFAFNVWETRSSTMIAWE